MPDDQFIIMKADTDPDQRDRWHLFRMRGDFVDAAFDEDGNVVMEYAVRHTVNYGDDWEYDLEQIVREGKSFQSAFALANKLIQSRNKDACMGYTGTQTI